MRLEGNLTSIVDSCASHNIISPQGRLDTRVEERTNDRDFSLQNIIKTREGNLLMKYVAINTTFPYRYFYPNDNYLQ